MLYEVITRYFVSKFHINSYNSRIAIAVGVAHFVFKCFGSQIIGTWCVHNFIVGIYRKVAVSWVCNSRYNYSAIVEAGIVEQYIDSTRGINNCSAVIVYSNRYGVPFFIYINNFV